ncbi:hypothetical protein FACS1894216_21760 [Synergistales bacterium]|nr:hypothetical protein FACS1894216_21760 [Synergistales bacterium]
MEEAAAEGELAGLTLVAADSIDQRYFAAVEAGDMETAQRIVDDQARKNGYISADEYRMNHRAPNSKDSDVTKNLADIMESGIVPKDYWTNPRVYQYYPEDFESFRKIKRTLDSGQETITMYRAVPKDAKDNSFRNGDWITPSRGYAVREGVRITGGYRIV